MIDFFIDSQSGLRRDDVHRVIYFLSRVKEDHFQVVPKSSLWESREELSAPLATENSIASSVFGRVIPETPAEFRAAEERADMPTVKTFTAEKSAKYTHPLDAPRNIGLGCITDTFRTGWLATFRVADR